MSTEKNEVKLLNKWLRRAKRQQLAHRLSSKKTGKNHLLIGVPATILSAVTSLFALSSPNSQSIFLLIGSFSLIVSILTSLQTFLKFDLKAKEHQNADIGYGEIRHSLEETLTFVDTFNQKELKTECEKIRTKIEYVNNHSPLISENTWSTAKKLTE
tara:strand:- start:2469 stop:2939 length:471 start_codon:yes stop_codon:yes gene_type:complete